MDDMPLVILPFMQHGDLLSYIRNENNVSWCLFLNLWQKHLRDPVCKHKSLLNKIMCSQYIYEPPFSINLIISFALNLIDKFPI
jgi:hypothetical protein